MKELEGGKKSAMDAMLEDIKRKNEPRVSLQEEVSTHEPTKQSRGSFETLSEQASIKHLIQLQISKANEQFSQI